MLRVQGPVLGLGRFGLARLQGWKISQAICWCWVWDSSCWPKTEATLEKKKKKKNELLEASAQVRAASPCPPGALFPFLAADAHPQARSINMLSLFQDCGSRMALGSKRCNLVESIHRARVKENPRERMEHGAESSRV